MGIIKQEGFHFNGLSFVYTAQKNVYFRPKMRKQLQSNWNVCQLIIALLNEYKWKNNDDWMFKQFNINKIVEIYSFKSFT